MRRSGMVVTRLFVLLLLAAPLPAATRLPSVVGDNMVLQRGEPVPVWGWDDPGTLVTVTLAGQTATATAGADGRWTATLPAMVAGGPHELIIDGTDNVTVKNVLIGEVWLCSGQSNMEWTVKRSRDAEMEIAAADLPRIRHIKIPHRPADNPQADVPSDGWKVCSSSTAGEFTAVGFFFARYLLKELDVPVGLLGCNWGGTRIEPWTPPAGFRSVASLEGIAGNLDRYPLKRSDGRIDHQTPLALYNGMIHPLIPYGIRGALWYQGESNNAEGRLYADKMKALILGWRTAWQKPDLPFYYVQLAPYRYGGDPLHLPRIWAAQSSVLKIPHTGMAATIDIGNTDDIHPRNKQDVGKRLALWALARTYRRPHLVYSGPMYRSMTIEGNRIRIGFAHLGDGLVARDGKPLNWFSISGRNGQFVDATAEIDGKSVVVWSEQVTRPAAVRFAWHQEAVPNLSNKNGLPAVPFRTD